MPTVGILEKNPGVNAVATKTLVDGALATLGRIVKIDTAEEDEFNSLGCAFVVSTPANNPRCSRARHGTLTQSVIYVHRRSQSARRRIHFEPGRCL